MCSCCHRREFIAILGALPLAVGTLHAQTLSPLPQGGTGIAARYAEDAGIGKDPAVVFADDLEDTSVVGDLSRRWDQVFHFGTLGIASDSDAVHSGKKALEMTFPQKEGEVGNGLMKRLAPEQKVLFLRYYQKLL